MEETTPAPQAQPTTSVQAPVAQPVSGSIRYVGFGRRFVAAIIDGIIVGVAGQAIMLPLGLVMGLSTTTMKASNANETTQLMTGLGLLAISLVVSLIIQALYYGGLDVYKQGQTVGKMALGIRVITVSGVPITWKVALLRELFGKWISGFILGLGYLWVIWDPKKQAWHDKIANTYVVYSK